MGVFSVSQDHAEARRSGELRIADLNPAKQLEIAKQDYIDFEANRPPFKYEAPECDENYPEFDETRLFELEREIFEMGYNLPKPPDGLEENHPLRQGYEIVKKDRDCFYKSVRSMRLNNPQYEVSTKLSGWRQIFRNKLASKVYVLAKERVVDLLGWSKQTRDHYRSCKQRYLTSIMAYMNLFERTNETDNEDELKAREAFHKTRCVLISHQTYIVVRSFIHNNKVSGVFRDSEEITMTHLYQTCVHTYNDYLAEIEACGDDIEARIELWQELEEKIMVALLHDFIEDLRDIDTAALIEKLTQHLSYDTEWGDKLGSSKVKENSARGLY